MNSAKKLQLISDNLKALASLIDEEIGGMAAQGEPTSKSAPKAKAKAKSKPEEKPEEPTEDKEPAEDKEPESKFPSVDELTKACRKLVDDGETDFKHLKGLCETFGVKVILDLKPSQFDAFYEAASKGE